MQSHIKWSKMKLFKSRACQTPSGCNKVKRDGLTCVRGWYTLGEDAVCDDIKHTERKHHREDVKAELPHILYICLYREISEINSFQQGVQWHIIFIAR